MKVRISSLTYIGRLTPMRASRSEFLVRKTHWMNSFWCLSLLPSQAANWHTFNSSVAWRAMRGAWETVRGRTARMQREKETASRHQKSVLGDRGEYNHSSMCLLLKPGSDTTAPMVTPPSYPHYNLLFGRHMQEGEDILETEIFMEIPLSCSVINSYHVWPMTFIASANLSC